MSNESKVAIIGVSGRFPRASTYRELWSNVVEPAVGLSDVVNGGAFNQLPNAAAFDHEFFGIPPGNAARVDPQHRVFLECVVSALDDAALDLDELGPYVSVYASCSSNLGYQQHVLNAAASEAKAGKLDLEISNSKDHLATRVGYLLNLQGECLTVQSACSSSLVAVHLACSSLLSGQSDMAIAGGVSVRVSGVRPEQRGTGLDAAYTRDEGARNVAFSEAAEGGVSGDGAAVLVLKRLDDAIRDSDRVLAVVAASAVNNDGNRKVGYTAPSGDGIAEAIANALAFAELEPADIDWLECHGSSTQIGDALELRAIKRVFESRAGGPTLGIGTLKWNLGELDAASGAAACVKVVNALVNNTIPGAPSDLEGVHPEIATVDWLSVAKRADWGPSDRPRRVGVTNFGIGGTNAHVIIEEPPVQDAADFEGPFLVRLSAASEAAFDRVKSQIAGALTENNSWASVEATLCRRTSLGWRGFKVVDGTQDASVVLSIAPAEVGSERVTKLAAFGPSMDHGLLERLRQRPVGVDALVEERIRSAGDHGQSDAGRLICTQLVWAELLVACGVEFDAAHGRGLGRLSAAVFCGGLELSAACAAGAAIQAGQSPSLDLGPTSMPLVGVETGEFNLEGDRDLPSGYGFVAEIGSDCMLETLGRAWLAGQRTNLQPLGLGHVQTLPTHPFQGVELYIDASGEAPSPVVVDARDSGASVEEQVIKVWEDILGISGVEPDDDFLELGGDSLQATRVVNHLQIELCPELSIRDAMEHRTARGLASVVSELIASREVPEDAPEYFCQFELTLGAASVVVSMTREEFDEKGLPDGARNIRIA